MPILIEDLSVWDISFRWAGCDPRKFYFRIPLEVENNFRNLMNAILSAEIECETISLEKRDYAPDEQKESIYYWLDDIYACIGGKRFNRKLFRWAYIERYSFSLWCERMNIPLPEFWFPKGWNLHYELPDNAMHPGYNYELQKWTHEERVEYFNGLKQTESGKTVFTESKNRPNQETRVACQQIAKKIWSKEPNRTIASVIKDPLIQEYGGAGPYVDDTVREWIKTIAPQPVRNRRGRPPKNRV